jgi:hypothetical protein
VDLEVFSGAAEAYDVNDQNKTLLTWHDGLLEKIVAVPIEEIEEFVKDLNKKSIEDSEDFIQDFLKKHSVDSIDLIRSFDKKESRLGLKKNGWTALHCAAASKELLNSCEFLINNRASIWAKNWNFQIPISVAAKSGAAASINLLNNKTPQEERFNAINSVSRTNPKHRLLDKMPLFHAVGRSAGLWPMDEDRVEAIKFFLKAGADPKAEIVPNNEKRNENDKPSLNMVQSLLISARTADMKGNDGECYVNSIGEIVRAIKEQDRKEFLNRKTQTSISGTLKYMSPLDICDSLRRQPSKDCASWLRIQSILEENGAERSNFVPVEARLDKVEAAVQKGALAKFFALSSVIGICCFMYRLALFLLDKSDSKMNYDAKLSSSIALSVGIVAAICCICWLCDHNAAKKIDCTNAEPVGGANMKAC